jgi:hypothetical protein
MMKCNDEHFENANTPSRDNCDLDSNVISNREEHFMKQESPRSSIVAGIRIDFNDEQFENDHSPILDNFDPGSNVISESEEQFSKQE